MAGIPDTRAKGKVIGSPPGDAGVRINGKPVNLEATHVASLGKSKSDRKTVVQSPYSAWSFARLAQLVFAVLILFAVLGLTAIGIIILAIFYVISNNKKISENLDHQWQSNWLPDRLIDHWLPSRFCTQCGQSIFDRSVSGSYEADFELSYFLPARECANCGHDHTEAVKDD